MTPEEKARETIDKLLTDCGWEVHEKEDSMNKCFRLLEGS
jgi:type I site-specific restriction endonuclease